MIETNRDATEATNDCLLTVHQVAARLNISARQTWKLAADGRLPKPFKLARSARWRESDVSQFLADGCRMVADH